MSIPEKYHKDISEFCRKYKVKNLYAFGSVLTNIFNEHSDIDFIVEFQDMNVNDYTDNYYDFKFSLQDLLGRSVDLLERKAIKNPYFEQVVNSQQELVYG